MTASEYEGLSVHSANHGGDRRIGASESFQYHNSLRSHKVLYSVIYK